jgi:hypothetical protein
VEARKLNRVGEWTLLLLMKHIVDFGHERKSIKNYFDANIHVQAISKTQDKHCGQLNKNKKESCYRTVFYALISNLPQH